MMIYSVINCGTVRHDGDRGQKKPQPRPQPKPKEPNTPFKKPKDKQPGDEFDPLNPELP